MEKWGKIFFSIQWGVLVISLFRCIGNHFDNDFGTTVSSLTFVVLRMFSLYV